MNKPQKMALGATAIIALGTMFVYRASLYDQYKYLTTGSYFTVKELCKSSTALAHGITNVPGAAARRNMESKLIPLLNAVRQAYGAPIKVSSGYRNAALNTLVNGEADSQHVQGLAADLVPVGGGSVIDIFRAAQRVGGFDQLIIETDGKAKWVHISISDNPRGEVLAYENGVYRYV